MFVPSEEQRKKETIDLVFVAPDGQKVRINSGDLKRTLSKCAGDPGRWRIDPQLHVPHRAQSETVEPQPAGRP